MRPFTSVISFSLISLLCACSDDEPERCTDPTYGNGTCDVVTSCAAPDIDCFEVFETPEAAKAWYDGFSLAPMQGPSASVTDAKFAHMQELLDEGWEAYKRIHDVGDLRDKRVQLVLLEPDTKNAFAAYDRAIGKQVLAVMVYKGLIDLGGSDAQLMGVVMHELEHALAMHGVPGVAASLRKFYAADSPEQLGFAATEDPTVRALYTEWSEITEDVSFVTDPELGGFPLFSLKLEYRGVLVELFRKLVVERTAVAASACQASVNLIGSINAQLIEALDPLTQRIPFSATANQTFQDALVKLANECFGASFAGDAIAHAARIIGATDAQIRNALEPEVRTAIEGKHAVVGFYNWISRYRAKARDVEAKFMTMTGKPFSSLRYFSHEEAADDSSVRSLIEMGLDGEGGPRMLLKIDDGLEAKCLPLVEGNQPIPYGENLFDDHHATCWRAGHAKALVGAIEAGTARVAPPVEATRPTPQLDGRSYEILY